ncbi:hypothetical protein B4N89_29435 [Embleya scabrispora]|uniref:GPP34 family phosphoprotein n=1 Tax=Embleya scabrispora TaxID=159449 RepID=A0A1T3P6C3_9ACTN|nr:GPP34 family phosphoprotein [Embleya scabrispora]OPC84501.1 hypothetical protein B4N89_29435 [Embleya scabrispora]
MNPSLPQRLFLLAYSPERQRLVSRTHLGATLQAAALYELREQGLIHDEGGKVRVTATRRGGPHPGATPRCELAADLLARIGETERARRWRHWVNKRDRQAVDRVGAALERARVIRYEQHRVLGLLPLRRIVLRQTSLRGAATKAMWGALKDRAAEVPDQDAALAVLAYHGELRGVLGGRERRAAKGRIDDLSTRLGPVPGALREAVRNAKSSAAG